MLDVREQGHVLISENCEMMIVVIVLLSLKRNRCVDRRRNNAFIVNYENTQKDRSRKRFSGKDSPLDIRTGPALDFGRYVF